MRTRVLVALVVLMGGAVAATGRASRVAGGRLPVLGFQSEGDDPRLIDRNARALTLVGVDGINLTGVGQVAGPSAAALTQLARARAHGLPAVLLVGNWSASVNDFSEPLAYQTLHSPPAAARAAAAVAAVVRRGKWDGVSVDLESLLPRDRDGLTRFLSDLRAGLPAGSSLTICVQASTAPADYRAAGYDLAGIAARVDQIVLMAYDDHGPWENTPGPIGPLSWQRAAMRALNRAVPAKRVFLGVADYGYAWRPHSNDNLTVAQARGLVARWHAQPRWVAVAGEWTATLGDGSTLWWSDARSIRLRMPLARALGAHGLAVWSLAGDPIPTRP